MHWGKHDVNNSIRYFLSILIPFIYFELILFKFYSSSLRYQHLSGLLLLFLESAITKLLISAGPFPYSRGFVIRELEITTFG